jgi:2-polyprenyl-3-methyl-5-hydroxy-6-metoxy-1,4-benzoquinol methylase
MRDLDELPRYSIIAGYLQYLKPGGSVLDVGCGEGLLQQRLGLSGYSKYVGIDISETAINEASSRQDEKTSFICADAVTYTPNELFDVIVFNEALYYFDEPLKMVGKYIQYLNENGIFITCLYLNSERAASIWKRLKAVYNSLDEVKAANRSKSWIFNVFLNEHSKT